MNGYSSFGANMFFFYFMAICPPLDLPLPGDFIQSGAVLDTMLIFLTQHMHCAWHIFCPFLCSCVHHFWQIYAVC